MTHTLHLLPALLLLASCASGADNAAPSTADSEPPVDGDGGDGGDLGDSHDSDGDDGDGGGGGGGDSHDSAAAGDSGADATDTAPPAPTGLVFAGEKPRNLLMISVDTFRPTAMGRRGGAATTDFLDGLFAGGVSFDDHRSCANWTYASVLCVQSGQRQSQLGFAPQPGAVIPVPGGITLASEVLADAGWQTALVTTNDFFSEQTQLDRGFAISALYQNISAGWIRDLTLGVVAELDPDRPWYLHVHYLDPHSPYSPPEEYLGGLEGLDPVDYDLDNSFGYIDLKEDWSTLSEHEQALIQAHIDARYAAELTYLDDKIEALVTQLEADGWLADTLVVFWSDHGEQLWERGALGHGIDLFLEETRAAVAFWADDIEPLAWNAPTTHADIWPTVFSGLAGTEALDHPFRGQALGEPGAPRYGVHYSEDHLQIVLDQPGSRLHYNWTGDRALYHLDGDPDELFDTYDPASDEVGALWEVLSTEVEALSALTGLTPVDPGP